MNYYQKAWLPSLKPGNPRTLIPAESMPELGKGFRYEGSNVQTRRRRASRTAETDEARTVRTVLLHVLRY
jgi:hypothetical protein